MARNDAPASVPGTCLIYVTYHDDPRARSDARGKRAPRRLRFAAPLAYGFV
jgi:hypothetical protein